MFLLSIVFSDYSVKAYLLKSKDELNDHLYELKTCIGYEVIHFFVNYLGD